MPNIIFFSKNKNFADDLQEQISLYAPEYNFYEEYNSEVIYDLVVIDERPDVLQYIRDYGFKVPVIYFQETDEKTIPLSPTDIIIKKPFSLDNFLDMLKSSINIFDNSSEGCIKFNDYELWPTKKEIINKRNSETTKLTEKEVAILKYLYKAQGRIISKNELLQEVWGYSPDSSTHTIETHIYRLRNKVEHEDADSQIIVTEEGGYKLKI